LRSDDAAVGAARLRPAATGREAFLDVLTIHVEAGGGGNGCIAFRREKFVPRGGPSGGDGGDGGDVILVADSELNNLLPLKDQRHYRAQRGGHGEGKKKHGRRGRDCLVRVPVGTLVRRHDNGAVLIDLERSEQRLVAARGGRGGRGNAQFASATRQAPRFAEPGRPGEALWVVLELKLIADVAIVGFPNAGKSTLLAHLTQARPKIADYPFTTLVPNLGVVRFGAERTAILADVPGMIEGAHRGAGLGTRFLRHAERTRLLVHLVEVGAGDAEAALRRYHALNAELLAYGAGLERKPQILALSQVDRITQSQRRAVRAVFRAAGLDPILISAVEGIGLAGLRRSIERALRRLLEGPR
jgi:GTP-binding protein